MIKAICFDLDGVFFTEQSFKTFCEKMAVNSDFERAERILKKSDQMVSFKKGEMDEETFWNIVRRELELTLTNEEIFALLRDSYEINPQVLEIVKKVRSLGLKTCICSNNFVTRIREVNKKNNFLDYFDVAVFSYEIGHVKPDDDIFLKLIEKSGVDASEILYSDDTDYAVVSAKGLGINAFLYEDFDSFMLKLKEFGVNI